MTCTIAFDIPHCMATMLENQKAWGDVAPHLAGQDLENLWELQRAILTQLERADLPVPAFVLVGSAVTGPQYNDLDVVILPTEPQSDDHFTFTLQVRKGIVGLGDVALSREGNCYESQEAWRLTPSAGGKSIHLLFYHPHDRLLCGNVMMTLDQFLVKEESGGKEPFAIIDDAPLVRS